MQRIVFLMMAGWLGFAVGCGGGEEPPADDATSEPAVLPAPPEVVSPLELLPGEEDDISEGESPGSNSVHPIAGRSAFPEAGESLATLIPAKKLSEEDQFREPIDETAIPDIVPWTEAKRYVGYEITVEGKIVDVGQSRDGKVNFLNFHQDWRGKFYMVVFDDLAKTLPNSIDATFRGKTLRVTGEVEDHRGRPQIKILSMDQVEIVGD